jgi:hypothetical protein
VYDLLGRRIATLYEGVLRAGTHGIPISSAAVLQHLSPGMYVYALQTRGGIRSRMMVVTR